MRLTELISQLERKARNSFDFRAALFNIATGDYSERDIGRIRSSLASIINQSQSGGYGWQAALGGNATQAAYSQIAQAALNRAETITNQLVSTLTERPAQYRYLTENLLSNVINQGITDGQVLAAQDNNFRGKQWVHRGAGDNDREAHISMNGVRIPIDQNFELPNGVICSAPHDWSAAGSEEWANCKCSVIFF